MLLRHKKWENQEGQGRGHIDWVLRKDPLGVPNLLLRSLGVRLKILKRRKVRFVTKLTKWKIKEKEIKEMVALVQGL